MGFLVSRGADSLHEAFGRQIREADAPEPEPQDPPSVTVAAQGLSGVTTLSQEWWEKHYRDVEIGGYIWEIERHDESDYVDIEWDLAMKEGTPAGAQQCNCGSGIYLFDGELFCPHHGRLTNGTGVQ